MRTHLGTHHGSQETAHNPASQVLDETCPYGHAPRDLARSVRHGLHSELGGQQHQRKDADQGRIRPSAVAIRAFLGRTIAASGAKPRHLICDKGPQFWPSQDFKDWCDGKKIKPRFGKVGEHGSIALVERFVVRR